jgi:hypothetical protein
LSALDEGRSVREVSQEEPVLRHLSALFLSGILVFIVLLLVAGPPIVQADGPWYVDGANGSDGNNCLSWSTACKTISQAITNSVNGDTIYAATGVYTVSDLLIVNRTLIGAGAGQTILDGNYANRVLQTSGLTYIYSVTIRHGLTTGGNDGGAVFNYSTLLIANSIIEDNEASGGGALRSDARLIIRNSTLRNNIARSDGGAIYNRGTLIIENSTLAGNQAAGKGALYHGGLFQDHTATLTNTTISSNTALNESGGIYLYTGTLVLVNNTIANNVREGGLSGSGLYALTGTAIVTNTLFANNLPLNCTDWDGGAIHSNGHNLDSGTSCGFTAAGDISATDPLLGPLQDNGGSTWTHALLPGSPAINHGTNSGCPAIDQRGIVRPKSGICDIGAYEFAPTFKVYLPAILQSL